MDITLSITKSVVMNEVAKQTSYIGGKITFQDGSNAYDQVFTTEDDFAMLEKYWREASNATATNLRRFVKSIEESGATDTDLKLPQGSEVNKQGVLTITLNMPTRYDDSQTGTIQSTLFNYFVNFITSKWLGITYKEDAEYYDAYATGNMKEILLKIFYKKPAERL